MENKKESGKITHVGKQTSEQATAKTSKTVPIIIIVFCVVLIAGFLEFTANYQKNLEKELASATPSATATASVKATTTTQTQTSVPDITTGQYNATQKAISYIGSSSFSRSGLIEQLEYEGFSVDDSAYGADHCGANWNLQAAASARSYMRSSSFSRDGLIEQLEYDGYTAEQAEYGVQSAGY